MKPSSESMEMYLKSVAELGGSRSPVPIGQVAERMGVTTVSANEMMKRLAAQGWIEHQPYKGVALTKSGRKLANSVIRRQRLWECFLVDSLKLDWARSHELACDLEHATADEVAEALAEFLGHPERCPHGNPIPASDGQMAPETGASLSDLIVGHTGRILSIRPAGEDVLVYLQERNVLPGKRVTVIAAAPLNGPLTLRIDESEVVLGLNLGTLVLVEEE